MDAYDQTKDQQPAPMDQQKEAAMKKKAQGYIERLAKMRSARTTWESNWQETLDYTVPRKGDVTSTKTDGSKRGAELFDTTAIMSNELLAGALHGMLTNPATRFFDMVMLDPKDMEDEKVRDWCQNVSDLMFQALNNTNFQTEIHEIYIDLGSIGTACLYMGEHEEQLVHFSARPIKEVYVQENNLGMIDTVYRVFKWNLRQIIQEFGEKDMHPWIIDQYRKGNDDQFEIIHAVEPQMDQGKKSVFEFSSCYVFIEKEIILSEGGFKENPYAVPRWTKTSGEVYGRGCGMQMLPDIKMVNVMMETTIKGAQLTVAPPLLVQDDGVIGRVRLTPLGLTVVRAGIDAPVKPLLTDARVDFGYQAVDDVRKRIKTGFYGDLFTLNEGPQRTATEVNTIAEQQMKLMGPVLGRQHFELLRPMMTRLFGIMYRKGRLPEIPSQIKGKQWDVRYSSLVARAQRMSEGQNLMRAISVAAPIFQLDPKVGDIIDSDQTLRYILDIYGAPNKIQRKQRAIKDIRDNREKAQAQMAKQQQEAHQAEVMNKTMPGVAQVQQAQNQAQ
jgi:hypothetical protein